MNLAIYVIFGVLGLIIGSFLNVVVLRLHTNRISKGRSKCSRCGHVLKSNDLIPVLSFIMLWGRCRYCKTRLSIQYPIVEIITSIVFVLIAWKVGMNFAIFSFAGLVSFGLYALAFSLLIAMSVYDIHHFVLPWKLMRRFLIVAFFTPIILGIIGDGISLEHLVSGFIVAFPLWLVWYFSRGRMIGFGDIELMTGMGFLLGISGGFAAVIMGFWIGAGFIFLKIILTRTILSGKTQIPFGPFLVIGLFVAFVFNITMNSFILKLI